MAKTTAKKASKPAPKAAPKKAAPKAAKPAAKEKVEKKPVKEKEVVVKKTAKVAPPKVEKKVAKETSVKADKKSAKAAKPEKEGKSGKAKAPKDEIILDDIIESSDIAELIEEIKPTRRGKGKQPKQRTLTAVTMPTNFVVDENPVIERSKSGRKSYKIEYTIKSSPAILFDFVTTPSGLVLWFADKVDINGDDVTFTWRGAEEHAIILEWIEEYRVRYRWEWMEDDEFFQFRIYKNEVTRDTILEITDFSDEKEIPDQIRLWDTQIKRLMQSIGS